MNASSPKTLIPAALIGIVIGLSACVGETPSFTEEEQEVDAAVLDERGIVRQQFEKDVVPLLNGFCASCHGEGMVVPFMGGPDMYATIMQWPNLISFRVPAASSLLNKGAHAGPAWLVDQRDIVRDWLQEESNLAPDNQGEALETDPIVPVVGLNTIDLSSIGLAGATITFELEPMATGMYLSDLSLNADAQGVRIVHPTFIPWDNDTPVADPVDRFGSLDIFAAPFGSTLVGGGTLILVGVSPTAPISVRFVVAEEAEEGEVVIAGCGAVAEFTANAQPQLVEHCTSCHGGGVAGATNATDMTQVGNLDPEAQAAACGQILSRVNLLDPVNSSIFLAGEPQSALNHPYKLPDAPAFTAFRDALTIWISAEQAAQGN